MLLIAAEKLNFEMFKITSFVHTGRIYTFEKVVFTQNVQNLILYLPQETMHRYYEKLLLDACNKSKTIAPLLKLFEHPLLRVYFLIKWILNCLIATSSLSKFY